METGVKHLRLGERAEAGVAAGCGAESQTAGYA